MVTVYECDRCHKQQKERLFDLQPDESELHRSLVPDYQQPFHQELCSDCERSLGQWQRAFVGKKV